VFNIEGTETSQSSSSYTNNEKEHHDGDTMSISTSISAPLLSAPNIKFRLLLEQQTGMCDPFSDPPFQIDPSEKSEDMYVPLYITSYFLAVSAKAARPRTETVTIIMEAEIQDVLAEPTSQDPDFEIVTLSGADVGVAINDAILSGEASPGISPGMSPLPSR